MIRDNLNERCSKMTGDFNAMHVTLQKSITDHKRSLLGHDDSIKKIKENLTEHAHGMSANQDMITKIGTKVERNRSDL